MRKILFGAILSTLLISGCGDTCEDVKTHCLKLDYRFKISEKSKNRFIEFTGFDKYNKISKFTEFEYWGIYEFAEVGDTLFKELGKTELVLIKKDTTLVFPLYCDGRIIE